MQGEEIHSLGRDELVIGLLADRVDVVYEEGIGKVMLGEEEDLGAAEGEAAYYCFTDA